MFLTYSVTGKLPVLRFQFGNAANKQEHYSVKLIEPSIREPKQVSSVCPQEKPFLQADKLLDPIYAFTPGSEIKDCLLRLNYQNVFGFFFILSLISAAGSFVNGIGI